MHPPTLPKTWLRVLLEIISSCSHYQPHHLPCHQMLFQNSRPRPIIIVLSFWLQVFSIILTSLTILSPQTVCNRVLSFPFSNFYCSLASVPIHHWPSFQMHLWLHLVSPPLTSVVPPDFLPSPPPQLASAFCHSHRGHYNALPADFCTFIFFFYLVHNLNPEARIIFPK